MAKIDRYILSKLMGSFGFFALVIVGAYWVNRAVGFFDKIVGGGHSIYEFLEFTIIFLPQVIGIVLPVIAFAAAIQVTSRLVSDSEIPVLQAAGLSPFRLIRPYLYFAVLVAILSNALSHYLLPLSSIELRERTSAMAEDTLIKFFVEGTFQHPSDGVTFYLREILPSGEQVDVFLHDQRNPDLANTFFARRAVIVSDENVSKLVMFDGMVQRYDTSTKQMSTIFFDEFSYDLSSMINFSNDHHATSDEFSTWQLLFPTSETIEALHQPVEKLKLQAHNRLVAPVDSFIFTLIGMATLMLGSFSRMGKALQTTLAISIVIVLEVIDGNFKTAVNASPESWVLLYVEGMLGALIVLGMLSYQSQSARRRRSNANMVAS